ncbi:MAG: hypothetical protein LBT71_03425 [Azoarcus sp.]|jgi:hypothetical protein|nr:hypothetical protein [Azoarcus sp.]
MGKLPYRLDAERPIAEEDMARTLSFSLSGNEFATTPTKVDRGKLYGWSETIAVDDEGNPCRAVSMDDTGTLMIPADGLGLGILDDGLWVDRAQLKTTLLDGSDAPLVKSSYGEPVPLDTEASPEDLLSCGIASVYQLDAAPDLLALIGDKIYRFTYSYRDSFEGSPAFVLAADGRLFMLVTYTVALEMLSLAEAGAIVEDEDDAEEDSDIDFSMGL